MRTIIDVARKAVRSLKTVLRVLNDENRVRVEKKKKVLTAAKALDIASILRVDIAF